MKKCLLAFVSLSLIFASNLFAQAPSKYQKVSIPTMGTDFLIPESWRYDTYSGSSVCDCVGNIIDNFDNDVRINLYVTGEAGMTAPKRDKVWSYVWDPSAGKEYTPPSKAKTEYKAEIGAWKEQKKDHVVIRLDANRGKQYVRIFIFGPANEMEAQSEAIQTFLESFEIVKVSKKQQARLAED